MFVGHVLRSLPELSEVESALDLCASPGGKTTLLAENLPHNALLVANEPVRSRVRVLADNVDRWGADNIVVTNNDPAVFERLAGFFDIVLVDAPCSGEGLFRKDVASRAQWSEANAHMCSLRQRRILMDAWSCLKPGGVLIYSTCTLNPAENEENIAWLSSQHKVEPVKVDLPEGWGVERLTAGPVEGFRFAFHRTRGEGFFVAPVRKSDGDVGEQPARLKNRQKSSKVSRFAALSASLRCQVEKYIAGGECFIWDDTIFCTQADLRLSESVFANLSVARPFCKMATTARGKVTPTHALALSSSISPKGFPCIDLDDNQIARFLKKESFVLAGAERGFHLARWQGVAAGFVNNLGNRVNTSLPTDWRILKEFAAAGESLAGAGFAPV